MRNILVTIFVSLVASSCCDTDDVPSINAMKPAYIGYNEILQFVQLPPQPIENAGKIMVYNNFLFLGEVNKGIHIIDISDTLNPVKLSFLKIPGNKDASAQNNRLYADNGPHFVILNIQNIYNVTLVQRNLDYFQPSEFFPPNYNGRFECADYSKGWLVEWREGVSENPRCSR